MLTKRVAKIITAIASVNSVESVLQTGTTTKGISSPAEELFVSAGQSLKNSVTPTASRIRNLLGSSGTDSDAVLTAASVQSKATKACLNSDITLLARLEAFKRLPGIRARDTDFTTTSIPNVADEKATAMTLSSNVETACRGDTSIESSFDACSNIDLPTSVIANCTSDIDTYCVSLTEIENRAYVDKASEISPVSQSSFCRDLSEARISIGWVVSFKDCSGAIVYESIVSHGSDCEDPVANESIAAPGGGEDVQYIYGEFIGWSFTPTGDPDPSCLENVTTPRTLYAAYKKEPQFYTVRFFDDAGMLIKEDLVAYGLSASPPDTYREDYIFTGWSPADLTITGHTDFIGTWAERPIVDVVYEQEVIMEYDNALGCCSGTVLLNEDVVYGVEYTIVWDGCEHKSVARSIVFVTNNQNIPTVGVEKILGNSTLLKSFFGIPLISPEEDTGEPYLCSVGGEIDSKTLHCYSDTDKRSDGNNHTVRIYYRE